MASVTGQLHFNFNELKFNFAWPHVTSGYWIRQHSFRNFVVLTSTFTSTVHLKLLYC